MTLPEFLLARFAEDAKAARIAAAIDDPVPDRFGVFGPERVSAECEAKRQLLILHSIDNDEPETCAEDDRRAPCSTLRILALPFADHPDYRPEWKP